MKKYLSTLLIIMLISLASGISVSTQPVLNTIIAEYDQPAIFNLTINDVEPGFYSIYTLANVRLQPQSPFQLTGSNDKLQVYVYPTESLNTKGLYTLTYILKKSDIEYQENLQVKIVELENALEISSDAISPESDEITFFIRNNENAKLENIEVKFTSLLFETTRKITLEPKQKTYISIPVDSTKLKTTAAGSYIIRAEFITNKDTKKLEGKMYLGAQKGITSEEETSGLIINTKTHTKINSGNTFEQIQIIERKNIISRLFTSFNIEPHKVDRQGTSITYTWTKELKPGEVYIISTRTNYVFPFIILISAILIILGFIKYATTTIDIKKSVAPVKTKGGEFALKVTINIKAKKQIENASLIDKIPQVVKIYEKFGILKPTKIDHTNRRIQWDIGELSAGEERTFNYIIYSKVGVVGRFALPEALVVFEKNNEVHEAFSDKVFFLSEQSRKDE